MTSSAGASGLIRPGSPPRSRTASRIVARSTTQGTPVKSCMITRAGVNWISVSGSARRVPRRERADVVGGDVRAVLGAQQVLEQDLEAERQPLGARRLRTAGRSRTVVPPTSKVAPGAEAVAAARMRSAVRHRAPSTRAAGAILPQPQLAGRATGPLSRRKVSRCQDIWLGRSGRVEQRDALHVVGHREQVERPQRRQPPARGRRTSRRRARAPPGRRRRTRPRAGRSRDERGDDHAARRRPAAGRARRGRTGADPTPAQPRLDRSVVQPDPRQVVQVAPGVAHGRPASPSTASTRPPAPTVAGERAGEQTDPRVEVERVLPRPRRERRADRADQGVGGPGVHLPEAVAGDPPRPARGALLGEPRRAPGPPRRPATTDVARRPAATATWTSPTPGHGRAEHAGRRPRPGARSGSRSSTSTSCERCRRRPGRPAPVDREPLAGAPAEPVGVTGDGFHQIVDLGPSRCRPAGAAARRRPRLERALVGRSACCQSQPPHPPGRRAGTARRPGPATARAPRRRRRAGTSTPRRRR